MFPLQLLVVFLIQRCYCVPLKDFYHYGQSHGDQRVPTNDDGSSPRVPISTSFPYFNQVFRSLYVNTNGAISFDEELSTYTPSAFPLSGNKKIVSPYWCDIDTNNGGDVWYYETNDRDVLFNATDDIQKTFPEQKNFRAAWVFVATWDNVAFFGASSTGQRKRNTFQCILITNGRHSFAIYLYNKIEWTTGTASDGNKDTGLGGTPAQVGFDAGDGHNYMAINESRTPAVLQVTHLSNVRIPGKFVYRTDTETVKDGGCTTHTGGNLTIFPRYVTMFGGTVLSIGGPCVETNDKISIMFRNKPDVIMCKFFSFNAVRCITPMMYETGDVNVTLTVLHRHNTSVFTGICTFVNPASLKPNLYRVKPEQWKIGENVTLKWGELPFEADTIAIELLTLTKINNTLQLHRETYVARKLPLLKTHVFRLLSGSGQAAVLRIHSEPEDSNQDTSLLASGWSDVFVMLPPDGKSLLSACYDWNDREEKHPSLERHQIDTCPCTIAQARLDISRFNPDPHCNTLVDHNIDNDTSINCIYLVGALQCLRMAFPGNMGHDNQCCYNSDGTLIETNTKTFGGTANRYHYKGGANDNIPYLSNIYDDVVPYMYCCQYPVHYNLDVDTCQRFLRRRPPSRCSGYIPPRSASSRGDPHLVTLDGLDYTFNGVGEFTMIQSKDNHLILQARMEQFKDKHGTLKQASVITSIAFRCNNDSDIVEVRLNEIRMCDVLINGQLLEFMDTNTVDVEGATIINSRGNNTDIESIWTSVTCRYPNIAVNVTAMAKMININIVIAGNSLRGSVKGLLGNFNGKQSDDLTNADDRIIPINSSLDVIHHKFGLKWQIHASDSLFTYPVGKTHQSFQHVDFIPIFNVTDQCPGNVADVCGDDQACRFDFCTTDDTSLAESTRIMTEEIEVMAEVALPACGEPGNITDGYWNFTGNSANLLCEENYILNGQTLIMCSDEGQWSVINTTCELKPCDDLSNFTHGYWNVNNRSADLVCIDNYLTTDSIVLQCYDNGTWGIPVNINNVCQRIACDLPAPIDNGNWNVSGRNAELLCADHCTLNGSSLLICDNEGVWELITSACLRPVSMQTLPSQADKQILVQVVLPVAVALVILIIGIIVVRRVRNKQKYDEDQTKYEFVKNSNQKLDSACYTTVM
ncbi:protein mesh-like [Mytilus trossulus]|uniref:protein mesh-like n=1 Tax=Mytilus trossulus TaxID=6551 RepID=UPI0030045760